MWVLWRAVSLQGCIAGGSSDNFAGKFRKIQPAEINNNKVVILYFVWLINTVIL